MSNPSLLRLTREIRQAKESPDHSIYIAVQEDDITNVRAAIIGSEGTPYAYGIFEFQLHFKPDYPTSPPHVCALTTSYGKTRFNPNVYSSGKVCLSILGTWRGEKGEQWSSAQGLESVLISIHSLLGANPYENEPGFEDQKGFKAKLEAKQYIQKILHETLRVSVADRLEHYLGISETPTMLASLYEPFQDLAKRQFLWHYQHYLDTIIKESKHVKPKQAFVKMPFEHASNTMNGEFDYPRLQRRFERIRGKLEDETLEWIKEGEESYKLQRGMAANLKAQLGQVVQHYKSRDAPFDISLSEGNPFHWTVVYFGPPMTQLDGGVFRCDLVFGPQFPEVQPRARFITPLFHVNVSSEGIPYYRVANPSSVKSHIEAITALLKDEPNVDPRTHLNQEAAGLYWGREEEKRAYVQKFRRAVVRSVEYA